MTNRQYISCYDCAYRGDIMENPNEHEVPPFVDPTYVAQWIICKYPVPFHVRGLLVPYVMYIFSSTSPWSNRLEKDTKPLMHYCNQYMKAEICPYCGNPIIALERFGCSECGYIKPEAFIKKEEMSVL